MIKIILKTIHIVSLYNNSMTTQGLSLFLIQQQQNLEKEIKNKILIYVKWAATFR